MYIFVTFVLYLFVNIVHSNELTSAQLTQFVESVNSVRSTVSPSGNLPSVILDNQLNSNADEWSQMCLVKPHPKFKMMYSIAYTFLSSQMTPQEVVDIWASESSSIVHFEAHEFSLASNYSAIVGRRSTKIGCSMSTCGSGFLYVCLLSPRGVYPGVLPYESTCSPQTIDCEEKGYCGSYHDGCKVVTCGPDCNGTYSQEGDFVDRRADTVNLDYRTKGVITAMKNQGGCGSCAAFTAIEVAESVWALKRGKLYVLSAQQAMDCTGAVSVCTRGMWYDTVFQWSRTHTFVLDSVLPYTGANKACPVLGQGPVAGSTTQPSVGVAANEAAIISALTTRGPIAVALRVEAGFQGYSKGVYSTSCSSSAINHAVTLIGYGVTNTGIKYWIGRNHWTSYWGEGGYFRIKRGVNLCNIEGYGVAFLPK